MKKRLSVLMILSVFLLVLAAGCQTTAQRPLVPNQNVNPNLPPNQNMTTPTRVDLTEAEARTMAGKLARMADQVQGVQKATVVVSEMDTNFVSTPDRRYNNTTPNYTANNDRFNGLTTNDNLITGNVPNNRLNGTTVNRGVVVMVGLNVDRGIVNNTNEMNNVKRTVANKLLASDNRIARVLVTTDPELVQRIDNVASNITQGRPIANFRQDINDLARSLSTSTSRF